MTKTPVIKPITTNNPPSGATNNDPPQPPKASASLDALNGQLLNDPSAANSFPDNAEFTDSSGSIDRADSINSIDINRSESFMPVKVGKTSRRPFSWMRGIGRSQSAEPRMSTLSIPSSEDRMTRAQRSRSRSPSVSTPSMRQREVAARTFAHKSPHHRMNSTKVWPDFQRDHFLLYAEKKGYPLAADEKRLPPNTENSTRSPGAIRDDELYAEWQGLKGGKISAHEFFRRRASQTKEERIAFALNLARILASRRSVEIGPVLSHSLNTELQKLNAHTKRLSQPATPLSAPVTTTGKAGPGKITTTDQNAGTNDVENGFPDFEAAEFNARRAASSRFNLREKAQSTTSSSGNSNVQDTNDRIAAEREDLKDFCDVKLLELYDDPVDEAKETLRKLLKPSTDDHDELGGAERLNWSPCSNDNEVEEVINLFDHMCASNNALVNARITEIREKRIAMGDGGLPRLGMPVELRGGTLADSIRAEAAEDFSCAKGWNTEKTFKNFLKDIWAFVGTALGFGFPLLSPSWADFVKSRYKSSYRIKQIEEHADARQISELREKNRQLAKQWVTETFAGYDKSGRLKSEVNNLDALIRPYWPWDVDNENLVEEVMQQLELATKADILFEKEKQAERLGLPVNHPDIHVPNEDYLLDPEFLREMARGVVEGVNEALAEAELRPETPSPSSSPGLGLLRLELPPIISGVVTHFKDKPNG